MEAQVQIRCTACAFERVGANKLKGLRIGIGVKKQDAAWLQFQYTWRDATNKDHIKWKWESRATHSRFSTDNAVSIVFQHIRQYLIQ